MSKQLLPVQRQQLIEWLCDEAEELPEKQTNADRILMTIYRIVHSHQPNHCCNKVHEDWREEAREIYKKAKELGEVD